MKVEMEIFILKLYTSKKNLRNEYSAEQIDYIADTIVLPSFIISTG
jgi:hypothetical protein